jgi:uncharacterized UBP type Zn finger protein
METLFYLDQIRKERLSELSNDVKSTRPFSQERKVQTHQPGLVKRSVDRAETFLIEVGWWLKGTFALGDSRGS